MTERQCETCRFWRSPDPTGKIGNRGLCSALADQGYKRQTPVGPALKAPFWAENLTHLTISWEGKHCPAFEVKPGVKIDGKASGRAL